ncbi:glucagon receptor-like [Leptopilina boulardi]|uniref:glucagon receptor-like n=1 Tax=Leptopilina boulardi TaxID=63433 RepID=UPI0021F527B9|nr:glucagon receptor-like [Leptopilina boulardi]
MTQEYLEFQVKELYKCVRLFKEDMNLTKNETSASCPPIFDSILCWPRTEVSQIAKLPCPSYFFTKPNPKPALAFRECLTNGKWFQNIDGASWGNYSLCMLSGGQFITTLTELNFKQTEYEEEILNSTLSLTWLPRIKAVSQIGYATSCLTLIIAFIIFYLHKKLQNTRNRLHMHLFASFILRAFMALLKNWLFVEGTGLPEDIFLNDGQKVFIVQSNPSFCKTITSIWQYCILANNTWILMEGLFLHRLIFSTLSADKNTITLYVVIGWGLPVMIIIPWIIARIIFEDVLCWTTNNNSHSFLIISIPTEILILFNFFLFLSIVRVLFIKFKTSVILQRKKMQYRKWARSTLILIPLLGIHHSLFIGLSFCKDYRVELMWLFFDLLFASFQGCFIAILYCFLNNEVKTEVIRSWKVRKSKKFVKPVTK